MEDPKSRDRGRRRHRESHRCQEQREKERERQRQTRRDTEKNQDRPQKTEMQRQDRNSTETDRSCETEMGKETVTGKRSRNRGGESRPTLELSKPKPWEPLYFFFLTFVLNTVKMLLFPLGLVRPLNVKPPERTSESIIWDEGLRGREPSGEDLVGSDPSSVLYELSDLGKDYLSTLTLSFFTYKMGKNIKTCLPGLL